MSKASFYRGDRYFEVKQIDVNPPSRGEVRIRVAHCGICGTDMHVFHGNMDARVGFERTIGHEMSGVIEAVGGGVKGMAEGDRVVVRPLVSCGNCSACAAGFDHICHKLTFIGLDSDGAMQELWNVPAHTIHHLPGGISLEGAAMVEPTAVACHNIALAKLQPGDDVVVIGAGPIGMLVALVARASGANIVISEVNVMRLAKAREMGFDVINPREQNLQEAIDQHTNNKRADVVFEVSGTQAGVNAMTEVVATRGKIVMVAIHAQKPAVDLFQFFWRELKLIGARVYTPADYDRAIQLIAAKAIDVETLITDRFPLDEIQAAFASLDNAPNAMKTLIKIGDGLE